MINFHIFSTLATVIVLYCMASACVYELSHDVILLIYDTYLPVPLFIIIIMWSNKVFDNLPSALPRWQIIPCCISRTVCLCVCMFVCMYVCIIYVCVTLENRKHTHHVC